MHGGARGRALARGPRVAGRFGGVAVRIGFDRRSLRVDGARRLIRAGSLHYFRLPAPELWRDRLDLMRRAGLNAVDLYYPWNYHSESRGEYEFSGPRDVDLLHDMIEEAGLYLIARPGPYVCAELDLGGLPAWLLRDPGMLLRCRDNGEFSYSRPYLDAVREWFEAIVPRFAGRPNLCLVQIENEYTVPTPFSRAPLDLVDLAVRWLGMRRVARRFRRAGRGGGDPAPGQTNPYIGELYAMVRSLGVEVPIFHNDLSPRRGRQAGVDILGLDRYPITSFESDWHDDPTTFDGFRGDEAALREHRADCPVFYPELQAGWYDGWGGPGYDRVRELLGPEAIDNATQAALAEGAALWSYFAFAGGTTWGYMGSPDVYSSYDYAAPIAESGRTGPRYEAVRRINEFLDRFEDDLCECDPEPGERWCPEHFASRRSPRRRFVFLRNAARRARRFPTPEAERAELAPWETQIRVYGTAGRLEAVSPPPAPRAAAPVPIPPPLPRLERWSFSGVSPQLDPAYDDSSWNEVPRERIERDACDIDALGVHYGFIWYRGIFQGPLDRLLLDARHCYAVWLNRECVAAGDQFQNPLGVGPDGARVRRIPVRRLPLHEGRNALVILVESLGHHKGFAGDFRNPRGLVRLDTGGTRIAWRFRHGLVRGERGMNPVVAFEAVERTGTEEVVLPHGWAGEPAGVGLYETTFSVEGVDPKSVSLGVAFDPGRGKANLYLNGYLLGRYWPERGPQRRFALPWGILRPDEENRLAIAVWKRTPRAALGRVRLEVC